MTRYLECGRGAIPFIEKYFLDCIYTKRDLVGFCFGMFSIVLWVIAQVPQFVSNYKNQSAEALSAWFLTNWLLGDTCNLIGCLLQGQQLPTTTYTAMYFIVADAVMMIQYIYYHALNKRRERLAQLRARQQQRRRHRHHQHAQRQASGASTSASGDHTTLTLDPVPPPPGGPPTSLPRLVTQALAATTVALCLVTLTTTRLPSAALLTPHAAFIPPPSSRSLSHTPLPTPPTHAPLLPPPAAPLPAPATPLLRPFWQDNDWQYTVGTMIGWVASGLYLMSRVSQIYRNHVRQSSEGLALSMFACAVSANLCTGTSILLRAASLSDMLYTQGPWILGSLGVISLDLVIFSQAIRFGAMRKAQEAAAAGGGAAAEAGGGQASAQLEAPLLGRAAE